MDSNLEIIKSLYENECQRIVECKDIKTGETFIYNTVFNQKLIKLIDINILNSIKSNIVKSYKTQDRLYIVTKPHELNNQKILKEYIDTNNLTLKQQFILTEQLINLFIEIYNVTDLLQFKILSFDNLSVSEDDTLYVNGYFEFKDEYDLSDNYSYKNLGNIIHYLFSKEDIVDYNISDSIPPDILKIIVKCLTREYFHPKDILKEFESSPIYSIINCKTDTQVNKAKLSDLTTMVCNEKKGENNQNGEILNDDNNNEELRIELNGEENYSDLHDENDNLADSKNIIDSESDDTAENIDDNLNIIDIYLNNSIDDKTKNDNLIDDKSDNKFGKAMKFIIPAFIIVFVTVVSVLLIKNLYSKDKETVSDNVISDQDNNSSNDGSQNTNNENNSDEDSSKNDDNSSKNDEKDQSQLNSDSNEFKLYLNDELIKKIGYTGKTAVIDTENYNEGSSSLLVENETDESLKVLFAVIDFSNDKLSYMKNNQVGIAAKFKALEDVDAKLVVEAYMNDKLSANNSGKIQIFDDIWSQKEITINVGDIDRVNLYIEYSGKNKVWIDTLAIDILK